MKRLIPALILAIGLLVAPISPSPVEAAPANCTSYKPYNQSAQYTRCTQGSGYFRSYVVCGRAVNWVNWEFYTAHGAWVWVPDGAAGQWSVAKCASGWGYWAGGWQ